ncbi:MAG: HEAT repeat domain-containing protein [Deltaproteobacteria bacterium]|nr:HEAT repeat domain-containing protein [Deltaproteobacteria bacterium]
MRRTAIMLLTLLISTGARAYLVAEALGLDELAAEAELIVKARAVACRPVADPWFEKLPGFEARACDLEIISVIKGKPGSKSIAFHHYARSPGDIIASYMPQHYALEHGRSYIVFARAAGEPGIFRQLWKSHRSKEDQGLLLAADGEAVREKDLEAIYWRELTGLLGHAQRADVLYALDQLDRMSGGSYEALETYERARVLERVAPLLEAEDREVAAGAIRVLGSRNPYLADDFATGWLATVGQGDIQGFAAWDLNKRYLGGELYWKELAAYADGDGPAANRALAIRALGLARKPALADRVLAWAGAPEPAVRASAAVLLADYPSEAAALRIRKLAQDEDARVRLAAAWAVGFGRFAGLLPVLEKLIYDPEPRVQAAAALSLLSFSAKQSGPALRAHLAHPQFRPLFVNALAREDARPYLSDLAQIVRQRREPLMWWGGRIPWCISWDLLYKHVQSRSAEAWRAGELDPILDALESPIAADVGHGFWSSSEPQALYALYLQKGRKDRARAFRQACRKSKTFDMEYFFDLVDAHPDHYGHR